MIIWENILYTERIIVKRNYGRSVLTESKMLRISIGVKLTFNFVFIV